MAMTQTGREADRLHQAAARVEERVMYTRRRRVLRGSALIVGITGLMVYLAVGQRDREAERGGLDTANRIARGLREVHARDQFLPLQIPESVLRQGVERGQWTFNVTYPEQVVKSGRSGVCCTNPPIDLFLQDDVRFVVVFDGRDFIVQRLSEPQFREQAASLGFGGQITKPR